MITRRDSLRLAAAGLALAMTTTRSAAAPLAETLLNSRGANVVIDASSAQPLGTQCVQVLLCAASAWKTEGLSLAVANRSPAFVEGLQLLGIPADTFFEGETRQ